jgi:hypothetical protein
MGDDEWWGFSQLADGTYSKECAQSLCWQFFFSFALQWIL